MSNELFFYDFCFLDECNFFTMKKIFTQTDSLGEIFFCNLHLSQKENDFFFLDVYNYDANLLNKEIHRKTRSLQVGETFSILYFDKNQSIKDITTCHLEKQIKLVNKEEEKNNLFLEYHVKTLNKSSLLREYVLVFEIKNTKKGTFIYGRLYIQANSEIPNPFNLKFEKNLEILLKNASNSKRYIENFKTTEIAIINCCKNELFLRFSMMKLPPNLNQHYVVKFTKGDSMNKGNRFNVQAKDTNIIQSFESIKYVESLDLNKESFLAIFCLSLRIITPLILIQLYVKAYLRIKLWFYVPTYMLLNLISMNQSN